MYSNDTRQLELTVDMLVGDWKLFAHPGRVSSDPELIQLSPIDE